jgi:hypothetical protein
MKVYEIILEDGNNVYKVFIPAESEKKAREYVQGNGEIVRCKLSDDYNTNKISCDKVASALLLSNFGQPEIDIITRALTTMGLVD